MIHPASEADRALLEEIFSDPVRASEALSYTLWIAGEDFEIHDEGGLTIEADADGVPVVLTAQVAGFLGTDWWGMPVALDYEIEGVTLPGFRGFLVRPGYFYSDDEIICATAGYFAHGAEGAAAVKFGEKTSFSYAKPTEVAYACLAKIGWYARINLPQLAEPLIHHTGDDAFSASAVVGEGLDAVEDEAGLKVRDRALNEASGRVGNALSSGATTDFEWEVGVHIGDERDNFSAALKHEDRYARVRVLKSDVEIQSFDIRYRQGVPPPANAYLDFETEDDSAEAEARARLEAQRTVREITDAEWTLEFSTVVLDPRIERGDVGLITWRIPSTSVTRTFRVVVEGLTLDIDAETADYTCSGLLLSEEEDESVTDADVLTGAVASGVVSPGADPSESFVLYPSGSLYPSDSLYPSSGSG